MVIISKLVPKARLLTFAARNPRLVRNLTEPAYDAKGYAQRPFFATLNEYWLYIGSLAFGAFLYFIMSPPLSEITPAGHQKYINQYSDKWYFLYPELENYVRKNYDKLKKEKTDPKIVIKEVFNKSLNRND